MIIRTTEKTALAISLHLEQATELRMFWELLGGMGNCEWPIENHKVLDYDRIRSFIREQVRVGQRNVNVICEDMLIAMVNVELHWMLPASDYVRNVKKNTTALKEVLTAIKKQLQQHDLSVIVFKHNGQRQSVSTSDIVVWESTMDRILTRLAGIEQADFRQALIDAVKAPGADKDSITAAAEEILGFGV